MEVSPAAPHWAEYLLKKQALPKQIFQVCSMIKRTILLTHHILIANLSVKALPVKQKGSAQHAYAATLLC